MKNLILFPLIVAFLIGCNQQSKTFGDEKKKTPPPTQSNTPPTLELLGNLSDPNFVPVFEFGQNYQDSGFSATDPEDGDITSLVFLDLSQVNFSSLGTYPVSYSITDSSGITISETRNIQIVDTTAPLLNLSGGSAITHEAGTSFTDPGVNIIDNFDSLITPQITGTVNISALGTYTLTYLATDSSGNSSSIQRTVTVVDTTNPLISLIGSSIINHQVNTPYVEPGINVSDSFDQNVFSQIIGTVNSSVLGTYTLTYNATDASGNTSSVQRTVNVGDYIPPLITLIGGSPITLEAGTSFTDPGTTVTDNFDQNLIALSSGSVNSSALGSYTLTYTATDSSGNSSSVQRTVTVVDTTNPVITLTGGSSITHEAGTSFTDPGALVTDNLTQNITPQITGTVNISTLGVYTLTYTATDSSGNSSGVQRTITVVDTTDPVIVLNGNSLITIQAGDTFTDPGASASDSFDSNVSSTSVSGSVNSAALGSYTLTYTASDSSGNSSSIQRTVNVIDTTSPIIALVGASSITLELGVDSYTEQGATASDNLDGNLDSSIQIAGTVNDSVIGSTTLTYSVVDSESNNSSIQRTVNVVDTTDPIISLTGLATITHPVNTTYNDAGATASDVGYGDVSLSIQTTGVVDDSNVGSYTLTYSIQDPSGNSASVQRTINVVDTIDPVITLTGDNPLDLVLNGTFTEPGFSASDNYDGILTSSVQVSGSVDVNTSGTYTLTYFVQDASGNTDTKTRTVNVADDTPPVVTILGDNPLELTQGQPFTDAGATAADNIDGDVSGSIQVSGTVDNLTVGSYVLTYSATDSSSNVGTATRTVNVIPDPNLLNKSIFYVEGNKIHRINILDTQDNEVYIDPADHSFSEVAEPFYFEDHLYFRAKIHPDFYVFKYDIDNDVMTQMFTTHEITNFYPKIVSGTHLVFPVTEKNAANEDIAFIDASGSISIYDLDQNINIGKDDYFAFHGKAYFGGLASNLNSYIIDTAGTITTEGDFSVRKAKVFENQDFAIIHGRDNRPSTKFDYNVYMLDNLGNFSILLDDWSTTTFPHFGISTSAYALFNDGNTIFTVDNAGLLTNITQVFSVQDLLETAIVLNDKVVVQVPDVANGIEASSFVLTPGPTQGDFVQLQNFNPTGDNDFTFFRSSIENGGAFVGIANDGSTVGQALYSVNSTTGAFTSLVYDPLPVGTAQMFDMKEIFHADGLTFFYSIQDDGTYSILSIDAALNIIVVESGITKPEDFNYYPGPF